LWISTNNVPSIVQPVQIRDHVRDYGFGGFDDQAGRASSISAPGGNVKQDLDEAPIQIFGPRFETLERVQWYFRNEAGRR
jgi:hypothetical protein